jgi:cholesterol transport system auxiliary component
VTVSFSPDMKARRCRRGLLAAAVVLGLAGCAAIIPQTPNAIFDLRAPGRIASPQGSVQVLVPLPTTLKALDTDHIAARPTPAQYAYLPGVVWSDQLPRLLQARLVQTLQNSGRVRAAALPGQGLLIDYQMVVDIRAFELTDQGAAAEFSVKLMDDKNGRVLRSKVFRHVTPVAATDAPNVVAGLNTAMSANFIEITRWAFGGK